MNSIVFNMKQPNTLKNFTKPNNLGFFFLIRYMRSLTLAHCLTKNKIKNKTQTSKVQKEMKHIVNNNMDLAFKREVGLELAPTLSDILRYVIKLLWHTLIWLMTYLNMTIFLRVPVNSTSKFFYGWIRNLGFNFCLFPKPIFVLVYW